MLGKRRAAMLFVRNLPVHLTQRAFRSFVTRKLKAELQGFSMRGASLPHCEVLCITVGSTGRVEHHGLIEVSPAKLAIRAIEVLNGEEIAGHRIEVHRYRHRAFWCRPVDQAASARGGRQERRRGDLRFELANAPPRRGLLEANPLRRLAMPSVVGLWPKHFGK